MSLTGGGEEEANLIASSSLAVPSTTGSKARWIARVSVWEARVYSFVNGEPNCRTVARLIDANIGPPQEAEAARAMRDPCSNWRMLQDAYCTVYSAYSFLSLSKQ
jgi:hypothetical protein